MSFANPAALWALTLAIPIIALHILRSRRIEVQVSSTLAWEEVNRPVAAARPWQRLRSSIPLFLQLLLVVLLALALAGPSFDSGQRSAKHLVVILDTSSSMAATDGSPTRLADAKKVVKDLADGLGDGAVMTVIAGGAPARVVTTGVSPSSISSRLDTVEASEGPFDSEAASSLALGMDSATSSVAYALVSDGGLDGSAVRLLPPGTEFHPVGKRDRNLGITNIVVSGVGDQAHLQVTISNDGADPATTGVRADVDRRGAASTSVKVPGHDSTEIGFDV
ncbi:MAG TPA: BatA and WFA domain-containing protein, partial [Microthrixaceae bacterium]|nr:BatA and WFA domain-containing protein [Microthrixaceae bacterium]